MCGIIGYVGHRQVVPLLVQGLKRVEYRGYDSAGIAFITDQKKGRLIVCKRKGKIYRLEEALQKRGLKRQATHVGIAHTRWATHGSPTNRNAHPHVSCRRQVAVVHNGIVENFAELKSMLTKRRHIFHSDTDTEVLAHLIEEFLNGDPVQAVRSALSEVEGSYGIAVLFKDHPGLIVFAKKGSPLRLGIGKGEYMVSSDATPFVDIPTIQKQVVLKDGQIGVITSQSYRLMNAELLPVSPKTSAIEVELEQLSKAPYPHYMLSEICRQDATLRNTMAGRIKRSGRVKLGGLENHGQELQRVKNVVFTAAGTSFYAGAIGETLVEEIGHLPAEVATASELANRKNPRFPRGTALWAISQSGETADLLLAIKKGKQCRLPVFGLCNVVDSSVAQATREHGGVYIHAGTEIGVASTKAFTSQVMALHLVSLYLRQLHGVRRARWMKQYLEDLLAIPDNVAQIIKQRSKIKRLARKYRRHRNFLFLGRGINYPVAMEGALKLKEVSYIHAEGYPAGEMKHGPIALISKHFPTVFIVPLQDEKYDKIIGNMHEIKARGGPIIAIVSRGDKRIGKMRVRLPGSKKSVPLADDIIRVPDTTYYLTPLLFVIPLQLFAYYMAVELGRDVDQPRNLAKSVTVE